MKKIMWVDGDEGEIMMTPAKTGEAIGFLLPKHLTVNRAKTYIVHYRPIEKWYRVDNVIDEAKDYKDKDEYIRDLLSTITYDDEVVMILWDNLDLIRDTEEWEKIRELILSAFEKVVRERLER